MKKYLIIIEIDIESTATEVVESNNEQELIEKYEKEIKENSIDSFTIYEIVRKVI